MEEPERAKVTMLLLAFKMYQMLLMFVNIESYVNNVMINEITRLFQ